MRWASTMGRSWFSTTITGIPFFSLPRFALGRSTSGAGPLLGGSLRHGSASETTGVVAGVFVVATAFGGVASAGLALDLLAVAIKRPPSGASWFGATVSTSFGWLSQRFTPAITLATVAF